VSEAVDQGGSPDEHSPGPPPWVGGPEITQSQLAFLALRRGQEDYERVLEALRVEGSLTVIPDP